MVSPSVSILHPGIRGQWLSFSLALQSDAPLELSALEISLDHLGQQSLASLVSLRPGEPCLIQVRFLLPPVTARFPFEASNTARLRAEKIDRVLWLTEQAEHHGKVAFRLGEAWCEVPVTVCV